jgi:cytochrome bd-type quinol oxidase subunit 2
VFFLVAMCLRRATQDFSLYPYVLPSHPDPQFGVTIANAAARPVTALRIGLAWWIPAWRSRSLTSYFTYRRFAGKVRPAEHGY